jgi:lysophospholipase L1-like esterase
MEQKQKIVFLGDSLTYRNRWSDVLPEYDVHNLGMDGDTTQDVLARINQIQPIKPDKIFLQIGINDLLSIDDILTAEDVKNHACLLAIARSHKDICLKLQLSFPKCSLYLCSLLPTSCLYDSQGRVNEHIRLCNRMIEQSASDMNAPFIDLYSPLADEKGELAKAYDLGGLPQHAGERKLSHGWLELLSAVTKYTTRQQY